LDSAFAMAPPMFLTITKFQLGEIFSFGTITSIVDKFGDLHMVSDHMQSPELRPVAQAPTASAPTTPPIAEGKQIQSAEHSASPKHSASVDPLRSGATRTPSPASSSSTGLMPEPSNAWQTVTSKCSPKKTREALSCSTPTQRANHPERVARDSPSGHHQASPLRRPPVSTTVNHSAQSSGP